MWGSGPYYQGPYTPIRIAASVEDVSPMCGQPPVCTWRPRVTDKKEETVGPGETRDAVMVPGPPIRAVPGGSAAVPSLQVLGWIHIGIETPPAASSAPGLPMWGMLAPVLAMIGGTSLVDVAMQVGGVTVVAYTTQALTGVVGRVGANVGQIQAEVVFQSIRVMDGTGTLILMAIGALFVVAGMRLMYWIWRARPTVQNQLHPAIQGPSEGHPPAVAVSTVLARRGPDANPQARVRAIFAEELGVGSSLRPFSSRAFVEELASKRVLVSRRREQSRGSPSGGSPASADAERRALGWPEWKWDQGPSPAVTSACPGGEASRRG